MRERRSRNKLTENNYNPFDFFKFDDASPPPSVESTVTAFNRKDSETPKQRQFEPSSESSLEESKLTSYQDEAKREAGDEIPQTRGLEDSDFEKVDPNCGTNPYRDIPELSAAPLLTSPVAPRRPRRNKPVLLGSIEEKESIIRKIRETYLPQLRDKKQTGDGKQRLFAEIWEQLCKQNLATFYITEPCSLEALELFTIAEKIVDSKPEAEKEDKRNGLIWQTLMPTVVNNQDATLVEDLPLEREKLILSDAFTDAKNSNRNNERHLLTVTEMETFYDPESSRPGLSNLHVRPIRPLEEAEKAQVAHKAVALYATVYPAPWMSEQTYDRLVFLLNMTLSKGSAPDRGDASVMEEHKSEEEKGSEDFLVRFKAGLTENKNFSRFFKDYSAKHGKQIESSYDPGIGDSTPEETLKLSACFAYFLAYFEKLPEKERQAFSTITDTSGLSLLSSLRAFHTGECMSGATRNMLEVILMFSSEASSNKFKYNLRFEYGKARHQNDQDLGRLNALVIKSENKIVSPESDSESLSASVSVISEETKVKASFAPSRKAIFLLNLLAMVLFGGAMAILLFSTFIPILPASIPLYSKILVASLFGLGGLMPVRFLPWKEKSRFLGLLFFGATAELIVIGLMLFPPSAILLAVPEFGLLITSFTFETAVVLGTIFFGPAALNILPVTWNEWSSKPVLFGKQDLITQDTDCKNVQQLEGSSRSNNWDRPAKQLFSFQPPRETNKGEEGIGKTTTSDIDPKLGL